MVLGNEAGENLNDCVWRAVPDSPPMWAVRLGWAQYIPEMTVAVTAEHAESLGDERRLLIIPRSVNSVYMLIEQLRASFAAFGVNTGTPRLMGTRRSARMLEQLTDWFDTFGVNVDASTTEIPDALRAEISDWFGDPTRPMFALPMSGGEPNAAWQLAVACYVGLYWETQAKGLDSIHFVASIDGGPNFRKNWTSNR